MGMFDTVIIEDLKKIKLTKEASNLLKNSNSTFSNDFQTKDLDNCLLTFFIDKNGQIWEERYVKTGKKKPYELPFKGWVDNRSFLERLYFKSKTKGYSNFSRPKFVDVLKPKRVKSKISNTFTAYNSMEVDNRYIHIDVKIVANNGIVKNFKTEKVEVESVSDSNKRKLQNEIFNKNMELSFEKRRKLTSKWYYPILKEIYNPLVFFSSKIVQFTCNKLTTWSYRWHGI